MENKIEILIVEDSPTQALKVQHFLEQYHYSVSIVSTGKEALNQLKAHKPSIVISDIVMPEMDGYELCKCIKANDDTKNIPVILLTTLSDPCDIIQGLAVGAEDYILKPFDNKELLNKIELLLSSPIKKSENADQDGLEISYMGKSHTITANREQILYLLISTYTNIINQNEELVTTHNKLEELNEVLENRLTELATSQDNLKMSEERFRILVQMIPDVVYRIDDKGRFTFINNAVQQLGYLPSELIGKHFSCIMSEDDAKNISRETALREYDTNKDIKPPKLFDERRTGKRATNNLEVKLIPKAGKGTINGVVGPVGDEIVIVEISSSGLYEKIQKTKTTEYSGTVGVVRDVTERKLAEKAILFLNEELENKVKERTKALSESKKDLEKTLEDLNITQQQVIQAEKLASLGTVIAGVAHELNNPLMGIINYVQHVRKSIKDEKLQDYLRKAEEQAVRSSDIVNNLLSYSRPSKDSRVSIDCKQVVNDATDLLDLDFMKNNIKVLIDMPETLPNVWAKHDALQQVFLNLLINARDGMVNSPDKTIHIKGIQKESYVSISIQDSGTGIPTDIARQIFDPFFTTKEPGKGTGLGLSVSSNIIAAFDGTLTCESVQGEGAKFIIILPIKNKID